jgi:hypothetical protein
MACDDAVVAETHSPRAYAECLAHLAEKTFVQRSIALAQAALGKVRQTSARIAQILDVNRPPRSSRSWSAAASLVAILTFGCAAIYSKAPRLIAFSGPERAAQADVAINRAHRPLEAENALPAPVVQAKWNPPVAPAKHTPKRAIRRTHPAQEFPGRTDAAKVEQQRMVHLTEVNASTEPVIETIWLVVASEGENPAATQVYQIQMWRVTVLRTVLTAPSRQVPRSET